MFYQYKEKKPYYYYDILIAEYNDIIEITNGRIINPQRGVDVSNGLKGTIADIVSKCEQYSDPTTPENESNDISNLDDEISGMEILRVPESTYHELKRLGIIDSVIRNKNCGTSDYSKHLIQPWSIWIDYNLNAWDADIIKRVLRTKEEAGLTERESRILDYNKIIHVCQERIRQLES